MEVGEVAQNLAAAELKVDQGLAITHRLPGEVQIVAEVLRHPSLVTHTTVRVSIVLHHNIVGRCALMIPQIKHIHTGYMI